MAGRLLGGIATSILYSAFESWVVYEHNKVITICSEEDLHSLRGFPEHFIVVQFAYR